MLQYSLYVRTAIVLYQVTHVYRLTCTRSFNVRTVTEILALSPSFDPRLLNARYVVKKSDNGRYLALNTSASPAAVIPPIF